MTQVNNSYSQQFITNCIANATTNLQNGLDNIDRFAQQLASGTGYTKQDVMYFVKEGLAKLDNNNASLGLEELAAWELTMQQTAALSGRNSEEGKLAVVNTMKKLAQGDTGAILALTENYRVVQAHLSQPCVIETPAPNNANYGEQFIRNSIANANTNVDEGLSSIDRFAEQLASGTGYTKQDVMHFVKEGLAKLDGDGASLSDLELAAWQETMQQIASLGGRTSEEGKLAVVNTMRKLAEGDTGAILALTENYHRVKQRLEAPAASASSASSSASPSPPPTTTTTTTSSTAATTTATPTVSSASPTESSTSNYIRSASVQIGH